MKVKQALDKLFDGVSFDTQLAKKLMYTNIEFITRNQEYSQLFSGRNIGCYLIKYTMYDKNIFYSSLFDLDWEDVTDAIAEIKTIPKHFKVARDDINLVSFYIAHRFLTNPDLDKKKAQEYAIEALNYFSYRTLVLITSNYFIYPISEDKANSLTERLSNKYIIKKLKNWKEYCQYRSEEFLDSKFLKTIVSMDDDDLPSAITDLYGRTKDTIKNIYTEFMVMLEKDEIIKSKGSVITDLEGSESIADRIHSVDSYARKVEAMVVDKTSMIQKDALDVIVDILPNLSYRDLETSLGFLFEFSHLDKKAHTAVVDHFKDIFINAVEYLQKNEIYIHEKMSVLAIMNSLIGNVLYARGTDVSVNKVKTDGEKLLKKVYKHFKTPITDRNLKSVRNGIYLYVVLRCLIS